MTRLLITLVLVLAAIFNAILCGWGSFWPVTLWFVVFSWFLYRQRDIFLP